MPVDTTKPDQVRGTGRDRWVAAPVSTPPTTSHSYTQRRNNKKKPSSKLRPPYQRKTTQLTPRFDRTTDTMAVDIEGCSRMIDGVDIHYIGSISFANSQLQCVYDTFADHGGERNEDGRFVTFINKLPPKYKKLGVDWLDLHPANGAQPIKRVMQNFIDLATDRTIIFHAAGGDMTRLDNSAAYCGLTIPWDRITPGPSLKNLAAMYFPEMQPQSKSHASLPDAIVTMRLYQREKDAIEQQYAPVLALSLQSSEVTSTRSLQGDTSAFPTPGTLATKFSEGEGEIPDQEISLDVLTQAMQAAAMVPAAPAATAATASTLTNKVSGYHAYDHRHISTHARAKADKAVAIPRALQSKPPAETAVSKALTNNGVLQKRFNF